MSFVFSVKNYSTELLLTIKRTLQYNVLCKCGARISASEAMCLLGHVSVAGVKSSCQRVTMAGEDENVITAVIEDSCGGQHNDVHVVVDRYGAAVRNERTREEYKSSRVDAIGNALLSVHSSARLTGDQAKHLLQSKTVVTEMARRGLLKDEKCISVTRDPFGNADEVWFQVQSGCTELKKTVRLSVNILNGEIKVIGPSEVLTSPEIEVARKSALEEEASHKRESAEILRTECPKNY